MQLAENNSIVRVPREVMVDLLARYQRSCNERPMLTKCWTAAICPQSFFFFDCWELVLVMVVIVVVDFAYRSCSGRQLDLNFKSKWSFKSKLSSKSSDNQSALIFNTVVFSSLGGVCVFQISSSKAAFIAIFSQY